MVAGYDVELVDEERYGEFLVKFKGPEDSLYVGVSSNFPAIHEFFSAGRMEGQSDPALPVPYKIAIHRLRKQNLPPQHR